ncbi:MAG: ribosome recycling factor [Prevotella sp.]|nr:ribosome recycling factor [Prevotella sp.]MBQ6208648.1 ribosome recycling factor [Prevotella sp.]
MSNKEVRDFSEKLKQGLELAERRMLQEKALRGEDIIVSSDGKTIQRIAAKELIAGNVL